MTDRMFLHLELMQKLDHMISAARRRRFADPHEIARLKATRRQVRSRFASTLPTTAFA